MNFWNPYTFDDTQIGNSTITHITRGGSGTWKFEFQHNGADYFCLCVVVDGQYDMDWYKIGGSGRGQIIDATMKQVNQFLSERDYGYFEAFVNWIIRTYN